MVFKIMYTKFKVKISNHFHIDFNLCSNPKFMLRKKIMNLRRHFSNRLRWRRGKSFTVQKHILPLPSGACCCILLFEAQFFILFFCLENYNFNSLRRVHTWSKATPNQDCSRLPLLGQFGLRMFSAHWDKQKRQVHT